VCCKRLAAIKIQVWIILLNQTKPGNTISLECKGSLFKPMCPAQYTVSGKFQARPISLKPNIHYVPAFTEHWESCQTNVTDPHGIETRGIFLETCIEVELFESGVSVRLSSLAELICTTKRDKERNVYSQSNDIHTNSALTCFVELREGGANKVVERGRQLPEISVEKKVYI
jgi:hypothetical protein